MNEINKSVVSDYCVTGEFDIVASVKPEKDSKESKTVTLRFVLDKTPLADIIGSSLKDKRINWQVSGRAKFNSIENKSVVRVDYKGGRAAVDPETAMVAKLAAMTPEGREKYIREVLMGQTEQK